MNLEGKRILLTGAAGGIGSLVAERLAAKGARVGLIDRNAETLEHISSGAPERLIALPADLLDETSRTAALEVGLQWLGGIDILINNAGMLSFRPLSEEDPATLDSMLRLNLGVPMQLIRQVLPQMIAQGSGQIVNVGSTFGSIGFAWFAAYSSTKAGLRVLSEALRRELRETGVGVTYIAPRAVKTPLNTGAIMRMAAKVKMNMDEPAWVADRIVAAIEGGHKEVYLGFPESLFVRINALLPRLVDSALRGQNRVMEPFARES